MLKYTYSEVIIIDEETESWLVTITGIGNGFNTKFSFKDIQARVALQQAKKLQTPEEIELWRQKKEFKLPVKGIQPDLFDPSTTLSAQKRFVVIGDAGSGYRAQRDIAEVMEKTFKKTPFASVLVMGDNVYEDGEPWLFKERIYDPYKPLFKEGVKFFPVLGNHDVRDDYGALQRDYWGTPQYYNFKMKDTEFFALDTTVLLPGYDGCYKDNPFLANKIAKQQLEWLDQKLGESTAKYKIVYGHYPMYSSGMHGKRTDITGKLRKTLEPYLTKHGVDIYLAGHEHHYEKSVPINGVTHMVSGAAGKVRRIFFQDDAPYARAKAIPRHHFMLFEMEKDGLKYQAIDRNGDVFDEGKLAPKVKFSGRPETLHLAFA